MGLIVAAAVVVAAVIAVVVIVVVHNASIDRQRNALASANVTLVTHFDRYSQQAVACEKVANPYRCLERADLDLLPHLRAYATALQRAGDLGLDAAVMAHAHAQAGAAVGTFSHVGHAPATKAAYHDAVAQTRLTQVVAAFGDSVNAVRAQLDPGATSR